MSARTTHSISRMFCMRKMFLPIHLSSSDPGTNGFPWLSPLAVSELSRPVPSNPKTQPTQCVSDSCCSLKQALLLQRLCFHFAFSGRCFSPGECAGETAEHSTCVTHFCATNHLRVLAEGIYSVEKTNGTKQVVKGFFLCDTAGALGRETPAQSFQTQAAKRVGWLTCMTRSNVSTSVIG